MPNLPIQLGDVSQAIQLSLAPVFLLTGIAGLLNVMTGRLARIIDRGRRLTETGTAAPVVAGAALDTELRDLERRRTLASTAITACTASALLVCSVTAALFLEVLLQVELKWIVGLMFTGSTMALVVGLAYFLREVQLANQTVRIRIEARH